MSALDPSTPRAVIFGCAGAELSTEERQFFAQSAPFGFILFARNCVNPDQLRTLVADLRAAVGRSDAPVLIDQEGGRVARLGPPHWRRPPAAARIGALYRADADSGREAAYLNARLSAAELLELGIDVNCAPVLDLPGDAANDVIGDRALGNDPDAVIALGAAVIAGHLDGGVLPVIKHLPGHGRALVDSHHSLPRVDAPADNLDGHDFVPFRALRDAPLAMTAHIVYDAFDPVRPATTSPTVIDKVIRGHIGFNGALMSDDLSMNALSGDLGQRAAQALAAGCDLAVHCNGVMAEMVAVSAQIPRLRGGSWDRCRSALAARRRAGALDRAATRDRLAELLAL